MLETVLHSKLFVPPQRPNLVPRHHLHERLNLSLQSGYKFTLVSAPAGFGKTTLVSSWAQQTEKPVAWLSLDENDSGLHRFLTYFVSAIQSIQSNAGEGILAALQSPEEINIELLLTSLLNETTEFSDRVILILDDYHLIKSKPVNKAIAFLLEHLSPKMHLIMLTRADPPFPLPRMRVRGELLEIRARELRLSIDETTKFLQNMIGANLSGENIKILQSRTEGWIAALQLAALAIQDRDNPEDLIAAFDSGHHYIVDYLVDEVLDRQTESLRLFLQQTSILSRLNGSVCNALTGRSDGDATLDWCEKANLFVSPLAGEFRWYRYHHLFADVMANRLKRYYPEQIPDLHLRAANWFKENELYDEAIKHALAAKEYQFIAEIVESQAQELLHLGQISTLIGWLGKLPSEILNSRPELSVDAAWVYLLIGKLEPIEDYLVSAEKHLEDSDQQGELYGQIAAIRSYSAARQGHLDQAIEQAHSALKLLPKDDFSVRCVVAFVLGEVYHNRQDIALALTYLREAGKLGQQAGNIHLAVAALRCVGEILYHQGKLAESETIFYQALELGTGRRGQPLPLTSGIYYNLAERHLAQRDLASARKLATIGLELGKQWGNAESQIVCYLTLAQVEHLEGKPSEARIALENAKDLAAAYHLPPGREEQIKACEAAIFTPPAGGHNQGLHDSLSERELEVLRLFAAGLSNQETAEKLIISLGTVKAHSSNIYRKLEVRNRAQAIIRAGELNLL